MKSTRTPLKAKPLRLPGQSVDEARLTLLQDRFERPVLISIFLGLLAGMEWFRYFNNSPVSPVLYTVVAGMSIAYAGLQVWRVVPELRKLRQAIDGEKAVGQFLEGLRAQGYSVFYDLVGVGFNVDHVLIGPAGVFTVETKTWSKPVEGDARILFDGDSIRKGVFEPDRSPVVQASAQAGWLRELLKESTGKTFPVRPVIAFPGWFVEQTNKGAKRELWVINPKALPAFLDNEPRRLADEDAKLASYHLSRLIRAKEAE